MSERLWYIKHCQLFGRLSDAQLARLEQGARMRRFPRNTVVYLPSDMADGVFLLADGRVKLCSYTADGKEAILAFIEPGELFGELALLEQGERDEHAETIADSTVILLPRVELERLMGESPALSLGITKFIGFRRKRIERRLKNLLFRSIRERLVFLLLDLAEQYGQASNDGVLLKIRLSHQDLAGIIGLTRETVTIHLGELQSQGLIKVGRQKIVINNLKRLAQSVDATAPSLPVAATGDMADAPVRRAPFRPNT